MSIVTDLNPATAKNILKSALREGVSVEVYLRKIAEKEDARIGSMREAADDELFMADLAETMRDFRDADFEK